MLIQEKDSIIKLNTTPLVYIFNIEFLTINF